MFFSRTGRFRSTPVPQPGSPPRQNPVPSSNQKDLHMNSFSLRLRLVLAILVSSVVLLQSGCSGKTAKEVTGTVVTADGKEVTSGNISFHPEKGEAVTGNIFEGKFKVPKVKTGENKVTIETDHLKNMGGQGKQFKDELDDLEKQQAKAKQLGQEFPEASVQRMTMLRDNLKEMKRVTYVAIPLKYKEKDKTPLTVTIKSGSFDLGEIKLDAN